MQNIWIILKSEFIRRVRSVWFIVITLLAPVLIIGILVVPGLVTVMISDSETKTIIVQDETDVLIPRLQEQAGDRFVFVSGAEVDGDARDAVREGRYDGLLELPASLRDGEGQPAYFASETGGLDFGTRINRIVREAVQTQRLEDQDVSETVQQIFADRVSVNLFTLTDEGEEADGTFVYTLVGYIMGFFIYIAVLIYGSMVMMGVIEEKTSRVVEVMVSSVRPFDLLMGKVLGIGAMGLVQLAVWGVLILGGAAAAGSIAAFFIDPTDFNLAADASQEALLEAANITIPSIAPSLIIWFVLFFLGGYLLYASLYAAVGAAVEQQQDAQSFSLPLTLLVVLPILFIVAVADSPNSTLAVGLSLVPFFSPILMVVRMAITDVPFWQLGLSYGLLIGAFIAAVWVSARIYRVGILMYGKKPSVRDLIRWFRQA